MKDGGGRPRSADGDTAGLGLVAGIAALWAALLLFAPAGTFVIDEVVYWAAALNVVEHGSLAIENGYALFGSPDLNMKELLRPVGDALVPQYPSGYPILAAPLLPPLGLKGMMLLNWAGAVATLWLCWRLALLLLGDGRAARTAVLLLAFATFLVEYTAAVLPHALSAAIVLGATLAVARAVLGAGNRPGRDVFVAGLLIGLGLTIRVDIAFVAVPLAAWAILHAPRPLALAPWAVLGTLPGLALATALNVAKFGIALPVTYGQGRHASADPAAYLPLAAAAAVGLAGLFLLRDARARSLAPRLLLPGLVALAGAAALVPAVEALLARLGHGLHVLLFDIRATEDMRHGVVRLPDGSVEFWDLTKKALGQSMPWLGVLAALAIPARGPAERRAVTLCALVAAVWMLPYALRAWHGGFATNMRYFIPVLPHLCILGAVALGRVAERGGRAVSPGLVVLGCVLAVVVLPLGVARLAETSPLVALQNRLPQWLMLALAAAALASAVPAIAARAAWLVRLLLGPALATSVVLAYGLDLSVSNLRRAAFAGADHPVAAFPARSIIYANIAEPYLFQLRNPEGLLAMSDLGTERLDPDLVMQALDAGFRVFIEDPRLVRQILDERPGVVAGAHPHADGWTRPVWEIRRAP